MIPISHEQVVELRAQFPILASTNYLISNSLGAVPRGVSAELASYYETWATRGVRAWEETWWTMSSQLGDLVAPLIGAYPGEVVFQPNVTLAHAVLFSAFSFIGSRRRVVTDSMHFPSILYAIDGLREHGAEIVVVPSADGISVATEAVLEAIDERTAFVNLSHVLFKSSYIHDLAPIARRAHAVGAALIVDGYQAVGSIPVDVRELGVDAYIGGCLKWLCGGPGAAFCWVAPEHLSSWSPRTTGWMSHRRPFAFDRELDRRDDAWRFLHGTPNISALHAARPGLEIVSQIGIETIRDRSTHQTNRIIEHAESRGIVVNAPKESTRRGGTVALDLPKGAEVSRALKARKILCDYRPGAGVRLSPHFYTLDSEIDAAFEAIDEIARNREWERFATSGSPVT